MLSYNESLKILKETNALLEGHFILSSGLHSKQYVQCAKLLSYPKKAEAICSSLSEIINNTFNKIDIIFGTHAIFQKKVIFKKLGLQTYAGGLYSQDTHGVRSHYISASGPAIGSASATTSASKPSMSVTA